VPITPAHPDYAELRQIADALIAAGGGAARLEALVGDLLRDCIDGVIKTPKTGRRFHHELQNSEKTYIGTCVEIDLRSKLELPRGTVLDLSVAGREVDVKFSQSTSWMIPPEASGRACILISANETTSRCSFGVFIAKPEYLSAPNRDQKRGITANGRQNVLWLVQDQPYPENFWQTVSAEIARRISAGASGNERMMTLFREVTDRPISRKVVEGVAEQRDFMRRVRADGDRGTRNVLAREGILLLSGTWQRDRDLITQLGLPPISRDEFMSHRLGPPEVPAARAAGFQV